MDDMKKLKSGTDLRGVAIQAEGKPVRLTETVGACVGTAFALWLAERQRKGCGELRIAVGHDSRLSGERLSAALIGGLHRASVHVLDCGLCTTPAMFMTTVLEGADGAVMVTASHMPREYNGYKFFTPDGGLTGAEIDALIAKAAEPSSAGEPGSIEPVDFLARYSGFLRDMVTRALGDGQPLSGLRIAVDAGNGAGGFYEALLRGLGADTSGSQYLLPDGNFPAHIPNPEQREAIESIADAVLRAGADLGVIFDADCDRAALVDANGRPIHRNSLIALTAAVLLREMPGITVVTDSVTSAGLDAFIRAAGGHLHRFRRGYRNVIDEAKRLNAEGIDCPLAMETSGHAALRENFFLDDGMYLVTRLIIEATLQARAGKRLTSLVDELAEPLESEEVRMPIHAEDFRGVGEAVIASIMRLPGFIVDTENREGVRMQRGTPETWFLLRLSVHDPLLVLNAESDHPGGVAEMLAALKEALIEFPEVDLSNL